MNIRTLIASTIIILLLFVSLFLFQNRTILNTGTSSSFHSQSQEQNQTLTLLAVGDIMLGRTVNYKAVTNNDFTWPYKAIQSLTTQADITFANLESPFNETCPVTNTGMIFCSDKRNIEGLLYAGVDVVNLANNHGGDQKSEGNAITKEVLTTNNIEYFGTNDQPLLYTKNGITIAFLGYNTVFPDTPELAWGEVDRIEMDIQTIRPKVDYVIVSFHWGNEYTTTITSLQQELAHASIDSGADIVIGHHPHWIQPIEVYKEKLIVYSLGNFIFDQMWSQKTREGLTVSLTIESGKIQSATFTPVLISDYGQPALMNKDQSKTTLEALGIPAKLILK